MGLVVADACFVDFFRAGRFAVFLPALAMAAGCPSGGLEALFILGRFLAAVMIALVSLY